MPVLKIYIERFSKMTGLPRATILDRLPYLGLDIEGTDDESVRIEYNPNRADFSSDYGIARALRGLVGVETGLPTYKVTPGKIRVEVDDSITRIRPYIACAVARAIKMDDETVRQLISMQEDLHNGIGRKRKKVSIGLHNLDAVRPPIVYKAMSPSFAFTPLGSTRKLSVEQILSGTETGLAYGKILQGASAYPILSDSDGTVLSFPPIINGTATKVDTTTKNLFVDVTSTDERVGDEALAIVSSALADAGAALESVAVEKDGVPRVTPDLSPLSMRFDEGLARSMTGLELSPAQLRECLKKTRLDLDPKGNALIPRYRVDILHPIDLAEEVAIGYGLDRIEPDYPPSKDAGGLDGSEVLRDGVSEILARSGFVETMSYDLVDDASLYGKFSRLSRGKVEVENPRTIEHYLLRDSILPSLMAVLSRNVKASYPQKIFEVGRVYLRNGEKIAEESRLGALIAHSSASFSEAKMCLEALVKERLAGRLETPPGNHWAFAEGRCARVVVNDNDLGHIGEIKPSAVASFGLDVPAAGFEIGLTGLA